ncbi:MAG: CinA family protein [Sedimentitalea sp.]
MNVSDVMARAKALGIRVATAESCTGGMFAAALTEIAGASAVFERGFVTYTNVAKQDLLGVQAGTLEAYGAVSEPVAREMALGTLSRAPVDLAVAITGIAGPGGSEFKPEGRVCFACGTDPLDLVSETMNFGALGRIKVRQAACTHALALLDAALSRIEQK